MGPCIISIFQYTCIFNKMQRYTVYLYLETALHVSTLFPVQKYMKGVTVCARTCMYLVRSTLPHLYWSQQLEDLEVH
jgi:hypothetical protein